jgi:hypothetical protein
VVREQTREATVPQLAASNSGRETNFVMTRMELAPGSDEIGAIGYYMRKVNVYAEGIGRGGVDAKAHPGLPLSPAPSPSRSAE